MPRLCRSSILRSLAFAILAISLTKPSSAATFDFTRSVVVLEAGQVAEPERSAATVLVEEIEKRTGIRLAIVDSIPRNQPAIAVTTKSTVHQLPAKAEGYRLLVEGRPAAPVLRVLGADPRGALFGAGALLRTLTLAPGRITIDGPLDVTSAPAYPIRGHQIGYRSTANSWDAWTVAQFDQYIRELALFGVNSIENIPFQDPRGNPLMKVERREMNRAMSAICRKYGLDYWVWTPADFDLNDTARRAALLARFDELLADSVELTGVFVPGGDPGHNPPELLWPFLSDVAARLAARHPKAGIWLSLQGFNARQEDAVYQYLDKAKPAWLAGLVAGPSSPPIARTRRRLDPRYKLRLYPDLTHNKICQYQVPNWDQAYALTLGREAINPRPEEYALIHNRFAAYTDGFISYSDGVHDDVNKVIWSALAWDPSRDVRGILLEYTKLHFGGAVATEAADAILSLERNWRGPLASNGSVEATLLAWQRLESRSPQLAGNWRWQMCLLRAVYDAYVRRRLLYETQLEAEANAELLRASGSAMEAMDAASAVLNRAVTFPVSPELRARIVELCERLFQSIGLQTSVEKYHASGAERGAVLDFVDYPLNNRWWLEDEFRKVRAMAAEPERWKRLRELATWENPGPGSFYDDIGHEARSPRADGDAEQDADSFRGPEPTFWWWDSGRSRARLSWQSTMWPKRMVYEGLDPAGAYVVRTSGYGQSLLKIDGERATPTVDGKQMAEFKEFPVPAEHVKDRRLVLTWDIPADEEHLNWRQRSRLAEVWLLKR
jgi:hypothetical protein